MTVAHLELRGIGIVGRPGTWDIDAEDDRIVVVEPSSAPPLGLIASPGFIDLQINGAAGHDLTADPTSIWQVGEAIVRDGVTAFLPTIVTAPREVSELARRTLVAGPPAGYRGARALGLHVEGPFISAGRIGAHDLAHRRDPDPVFVEGWTRDAGVRVVTLAPELPGAIELIRELVGRGIVVAIGHTEAGTAVVGAAAEAGATLVTHLFNAMANATDGSTGPIGAVLADPRLTVGLIADGIHVDPKLVAEAWRATGPSRFVAVTDAIAGLGMAPGRYRLGLMDCVVDETSARLAGDGRLAGSVLPLDRAVRNLRAFTGASLQDAIATVTSTPARVLGLTDRAVEPGAVADLTLLTEDLRVAATIVGGEIVHSAAVAEAIG
jgi:N-acetylglucosamine-6-phosphate deacetylase